jgi:hypothetical protein
VSGAARGYSWPPFEPGNTAALKHGAHSARKVAPLADALRESLAASAPWTTAPAFAAAVESWSWAEAQCHLLRAWIDEHGILTAEGEPRPAATELRLLEGRAQKLRAELGLGPMALGKLLRTLGEIDVAGAAGGLEAMRAAGREVLAQAEQRALTTATEAAGLPAPPDPDDEGTAPQENHDHAT